MADLPPVCAEGCVWMPMPSRYTESPEVIAAAVLSLGGWEHIQARGWSGDVLAAARLMRRLGPDEAPWVGCWGLRRPDEVWIRYSLHPEGPVLCWYAPVRFAGKVPDFGEGGLRLLDSGEPGHYVNHDCERVAVITLPPLPRPEHDDPETQAVQDMVDAEAARVVAGLEMESFDELPDSPEAFERDRAVADDLLADASDAPHLRAEVERIQSELDRAYADAEGQRERLEICAYWASLDSEAPIPGGLTRDELCTENERLQARLREAGEVQRQFVDRVAEVVGWTEGSGHTMPSLVLEDVRRLRCRADGLEEARKVHRVRSAAVRDAQRERDEARAEVDSLKWEAASANVNQAVISELGEILGWGDASDVRDAARRVVRERDEWERRANAARVEAINAFAREPTKARKVARDGLHLPASRRQMERAKVLAEVAEMLRRKVGCRVAGDAIGRARDDALLEAAREAEEL